MPIINSSAPYPATKNFALIGIGGNNNISFTFGNNIPNAKRIPKTAPEAPTVEMFIKLFSSLASGSTKF